jgi:hypothetical protein
LPPLANNLEIIQIIGVGIGTLPEERIKHFWGIFELGKSG